RCTRADGLRAIPGYSLHPTRRPHPSGHACGTWGALLASSTCARGAVRIILLRMANITFLGTGLNGAGFAEAAAKRGDRVRVWNRTASKAKALEAFGVRAESTVAEAVAG